MVFKEETKEKEQVSWDVIRQEIQAEIEQVGQELKEVNLMMEQSQLEVSRLAQRNALVTAQVATTARAF